MRRRNIFIAALVIAGLLVAFFATRSSGSDNGDVETTSSENCPPAARLDAAATTPGNPVSIDVLANDTDPDGDPLVFQILKTTGGTSTVDDGATPTDASDDRVQFTPAIPPPPTATIEYQAVDPRGASATSSVEVSINDLGTLPDNLRSEAVTSDDTTLDDATLDGTTDDDGRCGDTTVTSTSSTTTEVADTTSTTELVAEEDLSTTPTTRRSTSSKKKTTTTTAKKSTTSTTRGGSGTTQPTSPPTTDPPATTTTRPPSSTTTNPPNECGPQPPYGPGPQPSDEWREWAECMGND